MEILTLIPLLGMIGPTQLILIVVLIIVFFGAKKIPELMRGAGRGIKEFKDAVSKDYTEESKPNTNNSAPNNEIENK